MIQKEDQHLPWRCWWRRDRTVADKRRPRDEYRDSPASTMPTRTDGDLPSRQRQRRAPHPHPTVFVGGTKVKVRPAPAAMNHSPSTGDAQWPNRLRQISIRFGRVSPR